MDEALSEHSLSILGSGTYLVGLVGGRGLSQRDLSMRTQSGKKVMCPWLALLLLVFLFGDKLVLFLQCFSLNSSEGRGGEEEGGRELFVFLKL